MKKAMKTLLSVTMAASLALAATACKSDNGTSASSGAAKANTLKIYMFGSAQNQDKVLQKFYSETKDTLNTTLNFTWMPSADYKTNLPLLLQNKQDADLVFDGYWMNYAKLSSSHAYADLSKYFNNSKYPGLKKAFPNTVLNQVRTSDGKIYAIPLFEVADDAQYCFFIRKDLREKYNLPKVTDLDTLETYLKTIDANKSSLKLTAALGLANRGFFKFNDQMLTRRADNIFSIDSSGYKAAMEFQVQLDSTSKKVVSVAGIGDPDSAYSKFTSPFNTNYMDARFADLATRWAKYVQPDPIAETDAMKDLFYTGKVAVTEGALDAYQTTATNIEKLTGIKNDVEVYMYDDVERDQKPITKGLITSNNFLCVPYYSKNIDATMKFLDWIYSDQANHDLFQYGIENEDWKSDSSDTYTTLTPSNAYVFPGYELTWNPTYARLQSGLPSDVLSINQYLRKSSNYKENPLSGFVFDPNSDSELKSAYASYTSAQSNYYSPLMNGLYGSGTKSKIAEYYKQAQASGMETVRAAVKKQVQDFLDKKK